MLQKQADVAKYLKCCNFARMLQKTWNVAFLLECCIVSFSESFAKLRLSIWYNRESCSFLKHPTKLYRQAILNILSNVKYSSIQSIFCGNPILATNNRAFGTQFSYRYRVWPIQHPPLLWISSDKAEFPAERPNTLIRLSCGVLFRYKPMMCSE